AVAERVAQVLGDGLHDERRLVVPAFEVGLGALLQLGGDSGQDHGPAPRRRRQARQGWLTIRERMPVRVCDKPLHRDLAPEAGTSTRANPATMSLLPTKIYDTVVLEHSLRVSRHPSRSRMLR